ncbi:nucleoside monophosphate kinase [Candidatus Dependentiae bacterium]|nr:nucleoside monophosphate kinase [Candidatus Dependentiae bacterium]
MNRDNSRSQIFIFIGPPGAGKGTLSQLCVHKLGWIQLSTGNLCRKHIALQTNIGKQIDFAIKSGKLIDDSLMTSMVIDWLINQVDLLDLKKNIILDGFPRTLEQAKLFHNVLMENSKLQTKITVVRLAIDDTIVISRLMGRSICKNNDCQKVYSLYSEAGLAPRVQGSCDDCSSPLIKRADDEEPAVKDRLISYHRHANDLINFYQNIGGYKGELNVNQSLEQVFNQFISLIGF